MAIKVDETEQGTPRISGTPEELTDGFARVAEGVNVPSAVLPFGLLKGMKVSPKEGDKPACVDLSLRVPVDEDVLRAVPLLMRLAQRGIMISAVISQAQLSFGDTCRSYPSRAT